MNKLKALTALRDKVKAGVDFMTLWPDWDCTVLPPIDLCEKAYNGSLDAAKALHEAVLPDFGITVWGGFIDGGRYAASVSAVPFEGSTRRQSTATNDTPARAWLLSILKALIAQEEQA